MSITSKSMESDDGTVVLEKVEECSVRRRLEGQARFTDGWRGARFADGWRGLTLTCVRYISVVGGMRWFVDKKRRLFRNVVGDIRITCHHMRQESCFWICSSRNHYLRCSEWNQHAHKKSSMTQAPKTRDIFDVFGFSF